MGQFEDCIMEYQCFIRVFNRFAFVVAPYCPCAATPTQGSVLFIAPGPELAHDGPVRTNWSMDEVPVREGTYVEPSVGEVVWHTILAGFSFCCCSIQRLVPRALNSVTC